MANNNAKDLNIKTLLKYITFAEPSKSEEAKVDYNIGRFRFFFAKFKQYSSPLLTANMLFMLFALPLVLVVTYIFNLGMERFSYIISGTELPYFMANIGIGMSQASDLVEGQVNLLYGYRVFFFAIAATLPFTFGGVAGIFHVVNKFIWGEPLLSKKDSYGNNVPLIFKEFFVGFKKYWLKMLLIMVSLSVIIMAFSHLILNFIEQNYYNNLSFVDWLGFIFAIISSLYIVMVLIQLIPMLVMYRDLKFVDVLKNAAILSIVMVVPTLFLAIISLLPLILVPYFLLQSSGGFMIIILIAIIMVGVGFFSMAWTVYADYNAEKIITPIFRALNKKGKKKQKGEKKK